MEAEFWLSRLPEWLLEGFSPTRSKEDAAAWLAQWRKADVQEQARLEEERGWELMDWIYWFSSDNEEWVLGPVNRDPALPLLRVRLEGAEEQSPVKALEWLIIQSGCQVRNVST
jgi:hypothetical protein